MAASLVFRAGRRFRGSSDQTTNIQLYSGKEFTVKRTADDQLPSHDLATFDNGSSCMHIDSRQISKNHFRIYTIQYEDADGIESMFYCEDSESANGTYVNNRRIGQNNRPSNPFLLSDGDIITLKAGFSFEFKQPIVRQTEEMDALQLQETASFAQRYSITDRLLGSGIYGRVYLATEVATRRQVACKVVDLRAIIAAVSENDPARASRERTMREGRLRLTREVEILKIVNHPNIVSMKKAFRSDNTLYLFMELAPGGDLCSFVSANGGHLTDLTTRIIIRQITIAVQYLHSIGIVHRDIKPENILMMNTAVGHRVALTDFGCAANLHSVSRMDSLVGTFDYVAPEIHRAQGLQGKSYTKAVDMWSLGIVALCLLTGESLASFSEMKHIGQKYIATRLNRLRPDSESQKQSSYLTDRAKDFLTRLLTLDPDRRMTADQATTHSWFTQPSKIAYELNRLYQRSVEGWVPRRDIDNVIEPIPRKEVTRDTIKAPASQCQTDSDKKHQASQNERRLSRKQKDYTSSVYFSLDKHTRKHSHRHSRVKEATQKSKQQIIDTLRKSGKLFVEDGDVSSYTSPRRRRARTLLRGIRDVPPTDLFGEVAASVNSDNYRKDSSKTQLEQPSLPSEASIIIPPISGRRVDLSEIDRMYEDMESDPFWRPDSYAGDTLMTDESGISSYFWDL